MKRHASLAVILFLLACRIAGAQAQDSFTVRAQGQAVFPILEDAAIYTIGYGGSLSLDYSLFPFFSPFFRVDWLNETPRSLSTLTVAGTGLGVDFSFTPLERLVLRLDGMGGYYTAFFRDINVSSFYIGGNAEVGFRVSPFLTLSASGGVSRLFGKSQPLLTAATAGLSAAFHLSGLGASRVQIAVERIERLFPVFYSYYDDHPFGSAIVSNKEEAEIRDVRVSLSMAQYMAQPKLCAQADSLAQGRSMEVPLYAILSDAVLSLTENTKAQCEIIVDYTLFGSARQARASAVLEFYHRNAMIWDDDRKAAAFVSPTDPAALWFARFTGRVAQERMRVDIDRNLQLAMGLFEAERLYGINYVVDPSSSYVENSAKDDAVDYLQYPHQTLFYRGGDCDDLSILFAALLESVGVRTAFITIPGHIYMAFSLSVPEQEAREGIFDPALLISYGGQAWVPVEITMVKEGFVKAWRIGAKEWADNVKTGQARFYPMRDSWKLYAPVGIPDVNPRFTLPDEKAAAEAFDDSVNRYVAREIEQELAKFLAAHQGADSPEAANELGTIYGRHGMLKEAWTHFSRSADSRNARAAANLGNVAFLRADYQTALAHYQEALSIDPANAVALLGISRSQYELERFEESEEAYRELRAQEPELASRYGYLASILSGQGRARTFSERLYSIVWDSPSRRIAQAPRAPAAQAPSSAPIAQAPSPAPATQAAAPKTAEAGAVPEAAQGTVPENAPATATSAPVTAPVSAPAPQAAPETAPAVTAPVIAPAASAPSPAPETAPVTAQPIPPAAAQGTVPENAPAAAAAAPVTTPVSAPAPQAAPAAVAAPAQPAPEPIPAPLSAPAPTREPTHASTSTPNKTTPEPAPLAAPSEKEPATESAPAPKPLTPLEPTQAPASKGQSPASPKPAGQIPAATATLLEGFSTAIPVVGRWRLSEETALQHDGKSLFAKLVVPLFQTAKPVRYSFSARSDGSGWVGFGLHIFVDQPAARWSYGSGKSLLVWFTSDPGRYGDERTRLQLYRSENDIDMRLLRETIVPESIFKTNAVSIDMDPKTGMLIVLVNGKERLRCSGFNDIADGASMVFRALDRATFQSFRVEELQ